MTRAELLDLFTPIYDEFTMVGFNSIDSKHPQFCDVVVDPTKDYKVNTMSGLGMWDQSEEDSSEGLDHFVIGYEDTLTPLKYRKYFYVSFEANEQNEYAELKGKIASSEALGRGGSARLENLVCAILYNGFATAIGDGEYLFDTDHPKNPEETGTTYDNLLLGAFSHNNLEAAETQISKNFFDLDGLPMATFAGQPVILHAPGIRGPIKRVLSERADERPGTTQRDINRFAGKYTPLECEFLGAALGGSDIAWYIIYPMLKNLKLIKNNAGLHTASWIDNLLHRYYFDGWVYAVAGIKDWRGMFASTGLG